MFTTKKLENVVKKLAVKNQKVVLAIEILSNREPQDIIVAKSKIKYVKEHIYLKQLVLLKVNTKINTTKNNLC